MVPQKGETRMRWLIDPAPLPKAMVMIPPILISILWLMDFALGTPDIPYSLFGSCAITIGFIGLGLSRTRVGTPCWLTIALNGLIWAGAVINWITAWSWGAIGWPFVAVSALATFRRVPGLVLATAACVPLAISTFETDSFIGRAVPVVWLNRQLLVLTLVFAGCVGIIRMIQHKYRKLQSSQMLVAELMVREERNRIMLDLHDEVGHSLVATSTQLDLLEMLIERDQIESARQIARDVGDQTRDTLSRIRAVVLDMNSVSLSEQLERCQRLLSSAGIVVKQRVCELSMIPEDIGKVYAAILQETVTNILRHSHASRVRITVSGHTMTVEDDGVGLPINHPVGLGMDAIRKRANEAGLAARFGASHELLGLLVEVTQVPRKGKVDD